MDLSEKDLKNIDEIKKGRGEVKALSESVLDNEELVLDLAIYGNEVAYYMSKRLHHNKDFCINLLKVSQKFFKYLNKEMRNDVDICKLALFKNDRNWKYIGSNLKGNKELLELSIKTNRELSYLSYFNHDLMNDKDVLLDLIKIVPADEIFMFLSEENKSDKNIMLKIIKENQEAYFQLNDNLKADKKFIMSAIKQNRGIVSYLNPEFKKDEDIFDLLMKKKYLNVLEFLDFTNYDKDYLLNKFENKSDMHVIYSCLPWELRDDIEILRHVISVDPISIIHASDKLKDNKEMAKLAVMANGNLFSDISDRLKLDIMFVGYLVNNNINILEQVDEEIKKDYQFLQIIAPALKKEKKDYPNEYNTLQMYEREKSLNKSLVSKNKDINPRKKKI